MKKLLLLLIVCILTVASCAVPAVNYPHYDPIMGPGLEGDSVPYLEDMVKEYEELFPARKIVHLDNMESVEVDIQGKRIVGTYLETELSPYAHFDIHQYSIIRDGENLGWFSIESETRQLVAYQVSDETFFSDEPNRTIKTYDECLDIAKQDLKQYQDGYFELVSDEEETAPVSSLDGGSCYQIVFKKMFGDKQTRCAIVYQINRYGDIVFFYGTRMNEFAPEDAAYIQLYPLNTEELLEETKNICMKSEIFKSLGSPVFELADCYFVKTKTGNLYMKYLVTVCDESSDHPIVNSLSFAKQI